MLFFQKANICTTCIHIQQLTLTFLSTVFFSLNKSIVLSHIHFNISSSNSDLHVCKSLRTTRKTKPLHFHVNWYFFARIYIIENDTQVMQQTYLFIDDYHHTTCILVYYKILASPYRFVLHLYIHLKTTINNLWTNLFFSSLNQSSYIFKQVIGWIYTFVSDVSLISVYYTFL